MAIAELGNATQSILAVLGESVGDCSGFQLDDLELTDSAFVPRKTSQVQHDTSNHVLWHVAFSCRQATLPFIELARWLV
jgi:hypothetical protein